MKHGFLAKGANVSPEDRGAYSSWHAMRQRCNDQNAANYHLYGGRGIGICERWDDFLLFYEDMGPRPGGHSLDRIDNDGDYEPGNCKWSTYSEQNYNQRKSSDREYCRGVNSKKCKLTQEQVDYIKASTESERKLADKFGVHKNTIGNIRRGKTHNN